MHTGPRRNELVPAGGTRLWVASLVVCGLFVAEDPTVLAVRARLGGSTLERIATDGGLALAMAVYNYAGSRFVIGVAGASDIVAAMDRVDRARSVRVAATRSTVVRCLRALAVRANPFRLVRVAGEWIGRATERVGRGRSGRVCGWLGDLGAVNVLGVPGAGLALRTSGRAVSRGQSARQSLLFVGSWFTGARVVELAVHRIRGVAFLGDAAAASTHAVGDTFTILTDVTRPIGATVLALVVVSVVRYATEVQRALATTGPG